MSLVSSPTRLVSSLGLIQLSTRLSLLRSCNSSLPFARSFRSFVSGCRIGAPLTQFLPAAPSTVLNRNSRLLRSSKLIANMSSTSSAEMATADDVLQYWYQDNADSVQDEHSKAIGALWFGKSDATDHYIRTTYGSLVEAAMRGELKTHPEWSGSTQKLVAQIILLDQFTRNSFRNDAKMYAGDGVCLDLAREILKTRADRDLAYLQRVTVYLPLEHSEELADQEQCRDLFSELVDDYAPGGRLSGAPDATVKHTNAVSYLDFAVQHLNIVAKWGRFPHRNAILGRETTPEEALFLKQKGSSF